MQASITEHGTLLKEKGGDKIAPTLIKDCINEATSAIRSTKTAWNVDMKENLAATRATKSANRKVEARINKLFKTLWTIKSDCVRQVQAKDGK